PRFEQCRTEAEYTTFVNGSADHIEIDIERLPLAIDDELELFLNGRIFSTIAVRRDKEAEFDNWDDETLDVPPIKAGDELVIKYENRAILQGVFELLA
ncbi:hypothetical protein GYB62_02735, partial [bacterium]|nr:hypothetical protein [bacterium]